MKILFLNPIKFSLQRRFLLVEITGYKGINVKIKQSMRAQIYMGKNKILKKEDERNKI